MLTMPSGRGLLDQAVYEKLLADIDARLLRLESGEEEKNDRSAAPCHELRLSQME